MKIYSSSPYHDDFNESNGFYRILFKPGVAVQARELTQLQTIIQNQINRFGQNIFKEGAIVIPGQQSLNLNYKYVKLAVTYNSIDADTVIADLVGQKIKGQTTGITAEVLNYALATNTDPPTIFVRYLDSGSSFTSTAFSDNEIITNESGTISVQAIGLGATGSGAAYSVTAGVLFVKGNFVYFDDSTSIISKYTDTPTKSIGFTISESTVSSDDDVSLLDPAVGSFNYFAPGADRYQITLTLSSRDFIAADTDDDNYVEIARVEEGTIILQKRPSDYNILNDTLARRTYDESGNYVVRPYKLEVIEHLRTSNTSIRDGYLPAEQGGNADYFVNIIKPGKSYVLGYEIDSVKSQYVVAEKARDSKTVNNSTISTETGNYVFITSAYSVPDLAILPTLKLYNRFTSTNGTASGTQVGTARIRSLDYYSGSNVAAVYKAYLFDINMTEGYTFERDVKQFYYDNTGFADFTSNITPSLVTLTGSAATTNGSNVITGTGTKFISELKSGDYVNINGNVILVNSVVSDVAAFASANLTGNISGVGISRLQATFNLPAKSAYIYEFPYSTIKDVDPTNLETSYSTRRVYDRTLSGGNVSITAGTDEVFAPYSSDNYIVVNKPDGVYIDLAGKVTRSGSPTGKTVTFTLGASYGSNDVRIITTVQKSNSASDKKTKTLVSGSIADFTTNTTATARVLSLGQADIFALSNVRMSANAFGTAYSASNSIDITDRYELDNGQRKTHYDIGTLILKKGAPVPVGPIRAHFSYFTHSSGDFFSVNSYAGIDYKDIPSFTDGTKTYQLRDCLDFRPRIDTNGTTFTSPSEFLDGDTDLLTDYSYYIGRIDKLVIDSSGKIKVVKGISSEDPVEPATPSNAMALYVLKQNPYVFDVKKDIDVTVIDNKRFTMRDIGRIENRVKNLEYYTTLSLLEKDTSLFQVKDSFGFDRFKNGFIVDNFTGHRIGDASNPDYSISMDFNNGVLRPAFNQKNLKLIEVNATDALRASNNYTLTGSIASLPYTSNILLQSNAASRTENINPFSVINYLGTIELDPPSDVWFDQTRAPDIHIDQEGNYSTLANAGYGTVWDGWQTVWYGNDRVEERTGSTYRVVERIDTTTTNDVVVNKIVIPKMRSVTIGFNAKGMKPNTKLQAYFNDHRVTDFCIGDYTGSSTDLANAVLSGFVTNRGNIITDYKGEVSGSFFYDQSYFGFSTGEKIFRLTDSPTNGNDNETGAEGRFNSSGELVTLRNEIVSTRNGYVAAETVFDRRNVSEPVYVDPYDPGPVSPSTSPKPGLGYADLIYGYAFGRAPDQESTKRFTDEGKFSVIQSAVSAVSADEKARLAQFISSSGSVDPYIMYNQIKELPNTNPSDPNAYRPSQAVINAYEAIRSVVNEGLTKKDMIDPDKAAYNEFMNPANNLTEDKAAWMMSAQLTAAILANDQIPAGAPFKDDVIAVNSNPTAASVAYTEQGKKDPRTYFGIDPLAQTFNIVANPVTLTAVDLFFSAKDTNIPMIVEIRKVVNGFPTQDVIPFSRKVVQPSEIATSVTGTVATKVTFDGLVYLEPGEYAIVLLANSVNYRVWISQVGETDVVTGKVISEQPFVGVLFKSQNASTWTADQSQDLKFRLYQAKFSTTTTSTIDLTVDSNEFQNVNLPVDSLEAFPGSSVLRVRQNNHGLVNGSTARLFGVNDAMSNVYSNVFGVNTATINNVEFLASNVKLNSYTIIMPASSNVTSITRGGGNSIVAVSDLQFDAIYPALSYLSFAGTTVSLGAKIVESGYALNPSFIGIEKDETTELSTTHVVPCDVNVANNLGGARPFTLRVSLSTDNENISPIFDTKQNSVVLIKNLINNPSYASENSDLDIITLASRNNISFTNLTTNTGLISFVTLADRANVAGVVKGTTVTVSNSSTNSGVFRVLDVIDSGANLKVFGNVTTAAAANIITVTNGVSFVAEQAASGGSATAKYITKRIDFTNPSTSFNLRMDVAKPNAADVKVYYRTKLVGETVDIQTKEFVELENISIPISLSGEFFEVEKQIDNLAQFDSIVIKIVLLSSDSAAAPKVKNLRVIALE